MFSNCLGSVRRPTTRTTIWKFCFGIGGRLTELAGGDLNVLLGKGVGYVECGEAAGGEAIGIEPEAHRIFALSEDDDGTHAGNTFERIGDIDVEIVGDEGW